MKQLRMAFFAVVLTLPFAVGAKSNGAGDRHSFGGGFSSSKSSTAPSSKSPNKSYNSFSSVKPSSVPAQAPVPASSLPHAVAETTGTSSFSSKDAAPVIGPTSALSSGLNKNAAQTNALATLDARNAKKESAAGTLQTAQSTPSGMPLGGVPSGSMPSPLGSAQPAQTVIYQNGGNSGVSGWTSGIVGFMLGRAMSHDNYNQNGYNAGSGINPNQAGLPSNKNNMGAGSTLLRIFAWLVVFGCIGWVVWYFFFRKKPQDLLTAPNYRI